MPELGSGKAARGSDPGSDWPSWGDFGEVATLGKDSGQHFSSSALLEFLDFSFYAFQGRPKSLIATQRVLSKSFN